jgi:hypothetical protein
MKRSSSIAALANPEPESRWNYQDDVLATSMMLVSIDEDTKNNMLKRSHPHSSNGSMTSFASSRCSSRGSLSGWGSSTSRKSYKVDLASLASLEVVDATNDSSSSKGEGSHREQQSKTITGVQSNNIGSTVEVHHEGDCWGFFVDSTL